MSEPGTFVISRAEFRRLCRAGRVRVATVALPLTASDPDAFTPHGSEFSIDRWADDGGRA